MLGHAQLTPVHVHELGHLVYPARGVLSLVTEEGSWIAPRNRVGWVPAGFVHQHRAHGRTDMRIMFVDAGLAKRLPAGPAVLAATPLARELALAITEVGGGVGPVGTQVSGPVRRDRQRLRRVLIDELTAVGEAPLHLPEPKDARLRAATRLVEQDLAAPDTLSQIARKVGASERTLSRLFARETGMSFRQWRTELRVHRALLLLTDGMQVLDVAVACGWANPSSFIAAFTALVGQTPGEYQRGLGE